MKKYGFKKGSRISGVDPDLVGKELERIRSENGGRLSAKAVVDGARSEDAPLHPYFEWDDAKAAEEHRLDQSRRLIRVVVEVSEKGEETSVYVHVKPDEGREGYYQNLHVAVQNIDEYQKALQEATQRIASAQRSVDELHNAAKGAKHKKDRVYINMAIDAMAAARTALQQLPIHPANAQSSSFGQQPTA